MFPHVDEMEKKRVLTHLTLEGERGADLVAGLVELGGVEGEAEAEGGAGVELGAVGEGSNAAVVDLDLLFSRAVSHHSLRNTRT